MSITRDHRTRIVGIRNCREWQGHRPRTEWRVFGTFTVTCIAFLGWFIFHFYLPVPPYPLWIGSGKSFDFIESSSRVDPLKRSGWGYSPKRKSTSRVNGILSWELSYVGFFTHEMAYGNHFHNLWPITIDICWYSNGIWRLLPPSDSQDFCEASLDPDISATTHSFSEKLISMKDFDHI